jgi:alkanesulfonate monooxygenase SsuD/methylene tetrahydromethanopterin reductase-like flavin-dependent oxidoreductase (luciferase family)
LGEDFHTRGRRVEEQVELLRRLWAEPVIDFQGEFDSIPMAGLNPLPGRRIPIWMGGTAEAAKRRIARIADGWMMNAGTEADPAAAVVQVRQMVADAGRNPKDFGCEVRLGIRDGLERTAEELSEWHELGISHATVNPMGSGLEWPKGHVDALERLARLYRED